MTIREKIVIEGDSRDARDAVGKARASFIELGRVLEFGLGNALARAGDAVLGFAGDTLQAGVQAAETANAFEVVFGEAVATLTDEIGEFATMAGVTGTQMKELLVTSGSIAQGFGATQQEAALLSEATIRLAADFNSLRNVQGGTERVAQALNSAYAGETEALKGLGIVIRQAQVEQRALLDTGKASADQLTQLEKAQATYNLAVEQAGPAIGDLERTQDSAANTMRRLNALIGESQEAIGGALLPVIEQVLPELIELVPAIEDAGLAFVGLVQALSPAIDQIDNVGTAITGTIFIAQLFGAIFSEDAARAKDLTIALHDARTEIKAGRDEYDAAADSLLFLAQRNSLTTTEIEGLRRGLGLTEDEMRGLIEIVRAHAVATGDDAAAQAFLGDAMDFLHGDLIRQHEQFQQGVRDHEAWGQSLDEAGRGIGRRLRSVTEATQEARLVQLAFGADLPTASIRDYRIEGQALVDTLELVEGRARRAGNALLAAADPAFAAADAFATYQEALAAANEDSEVTADEQLAIAEAALRAQAAFDALAAGSNLENSILAIATALGLSADEAKDLLTQLGLLDGERVTVVVDANVGPVGDAVRRVATRERIIDAGAFQAGGKIPGSPSQAFRATVHGGEIIVPAAGPAGLSPALQAELAARMGTAGSSPTGGGGIVIENATFEITAGGFDLTNPAETRRMMRAIENTIRRQATAGPRRPPGVGIT